MARFEPVLFGFTAAFTCLVCTSSVNAQVPETNPSATELSLLEWHSFYAEQVQPILENRCYECHGPEVQESGLRLDEMNSLRVGGDSGEPAIQPGDTERSHLLMLVTAADPAEVMPPDGERLNEQEIAILKKWIETAPDWKTQGIQDQVDAEVLEHWAFQPIRVPAIPTLTSTTLPSAASSSTASAISADSAHPESVLDADGNALGPIDRFIRHRLHENNLVPNPIASRRTLIRRLYLDLHGLPPTAEQIQAFENDPSPLAYENLVAKLLSDPAYGERWGRYWLDLVRFAETDGYETNRERPNAWPFRDYVIESLNHDKPFDLFVQEHLAGDRLGQPVATGYLVAGTRDIVKSPDIVLTKTQRQNELDDMINTTGTAMLGLTLGCARCHNHKFDPVSQADYYALQAVFSGVQHGERPLPMDHGRQQQIQDVEQLVQQTEKTIAPYRVADSTLRPSVTSTSNIEEFAPTVARFLRFTISKTTGGEPCIDELEVFSKLQNVALASAGTVAKASGTLPGYAIHQLEHVNDGKFGNEHSWISNTSGTGWVELTFSQPVEINRVVWGRDRGGRFSDRLATAYKVEVSIDGESWQTVASNEDRLAFGQTAPPVRYDFESLEADRQIELKAAVNRLESLQQQLKTLRTPPTVYAGNFTSPEKTYRLFRGDPMAPREAIAPDTIAVLGDLQLDELATDVERRSQLAEWIVAPENPLTARVIVNRLWQHHLGIGFVPTPSDFGKAGVEPSHPELLDYLASRLMSHDWSLKAIHEEILLSATYRQSSAPNSAALQTDAGNQWLWRFTPRRLEAEAIRDSILFVTGVLQRTMGGPGFSAFEVELENVRHYHPKASYGPDDWRRMIYMTKVRQEQDSVFGIFDCPDGSTTVPARGRSTTPLQALNLFNSPFMIQQAELFSQSLKRKSSDDVSQQVTDAYWRCYGRAPDLEELERSEKFIASQGLESFCRALLNSNEFLFLH